MNQSDRTKAELTFPFNPPDCKHFTGYKPCFPYKNCFEECADPAPRGTRVLLVNLDAMGAVLQTTSLLPAIKRKYPGSSVSWLTLRNALPLLQNNPHLDRVYSWNPETWLVLQQMEFDLVLNADKTQRSAALTMSLHAGEKLGFGLDQKGVITPLNLESMYLYRLGIDDDLKFRKNMRTGQEILAEAFRLPYERDECALGLTDAELAYQEQYRRENRLDDRKLVVGFNTGCSTLYPNKKMTIEQHEALINRIGEIPDVKMILLGGPEDTGRNAEIARRVGGKVLVTPTQEGTRWGMVYENVADVVITGDSFGMHLAIALKKFVIAWFGLSCWTEIDLYDRGEKLYTAGLFCAPCWKKECPYNLECIQMIDLDRIVGCVGEYASRRSSNVKGPDTRATQ